jgi:uncharacterized protein YecT (DUF1311 family)
MRGQSVKYILIAAAAALALAASPAFAKGAALYKQQDCNAFTTQTDLNICADTNAQAADAALNAAYKKLMSQQGDAASKDQLKEIERAWLAYRDKECAFEVGPREDGGSIWPMELANCEERMTAARLIELAPLICTGGVSVCDPHTK